MEDPVKSYQLFWDNDLDRGGVTLVLQSGEEILLRTERPEVLKLWGHMLLTNRAAYSRSAGAERIVTAWKVPKPVHPFPARKDTTKP